VTAIRLLARDQPDEAYFAAQRMLSRKSLPVAAELMLVINAERGTQDLIDRYPGVKPSLRLELRRVLRGRIGGVALSALIGPLAAAPAARSRMVAAEIAGAIPPSVDLPWLQQLAEDASPLVVDAARQALRARGNEEAALEHQDLLLSSPKPLQWVRLTKIIELIDPYFIWSASDPSSLRSTLEHLPFEFTVEARQVRQKHLKEREDAAKKGDRDA
jgi:hypothetical protein